jgi:Arylsulfotransferase (ASST)
VKKILILLIALVIISGLVYFLLLRPGDDPESRGAGSSPSNLEKLKSLPYLTWSNEAADKRLNRVTIYNPEKAFDGYNLYTDAEKYAYLRDMEGKILHRWEFPSEGEWEYAELLDNGDILAYCAGESFARIDRDSNVLRLDSIPVHHDIAIISDGTCWVPVSTPHRLHRSRLIQFDSILHLSSEWGKLDEWSSFSSLESLQSLHHPSPFDVAPEISSISAALKRFYQHRISGLSTRVHEIDKWFRAIVGLEKFDYYHLNTVEILPETELGRRDPRFAAGNILTCLRHADIILIIDPETGEIVWNWGPGILDWPHMPTMLDNGHILVYDNGAHRTYSRILEIEPVEKRIVWEYRADPPEKFHSETRGSNQRLPNGNTLICESERGHVFEITPSGEVVWEFYNPDIRDGRRRLIYRMTRIPKAAADQWLEARIDK